MTELQLIFLVIGILLFGAIALYSWLMINQPSRTGRRAFDRALRNEVSAPENEQSTAAVVSSDAADDIQFEYKDERSDSDTQAIANAHSKIEPLLDEVEKATDEIALQVDSNHEDSKSSGEAKRAVESGSRSSTFGAASSAANRIANKIVGLARRADRDELAVDSTPRSIGVVSVENSPAHAVASPKSALEKPKRSESDGAVIVDLVARIKIKEPLEQNELLGLLREHDFKFRRAIKLYGLNQLTDIWCDIESELPSAQFVDLGLSIQLADRQGAMSTKESHDFQQMVLEFTTRWDAPFEFSMDIDEALEQAQLLDRLGSHFDSMAVLNIVPKSRTGFRVADVESCARDLLMSSDRRGVFLKTAGQRNDLTVLYRLACTDGDGQYGVSTANGSEIFDLVLYMNVPATQTPEMIFQQMIDDANQLAVWLEGKVVDRSGKTMTPRMFSALLKQVSEISHGMRAIGLTPGDVVCKKIF